MTNRYYRDHLHYKRFDKGELVRERQSQKTSGEGEGNKSYSLLHNL